MYCRLNVHVRADFTTVLRAARRRIQPQHRTSLDHRVRAARRALYADLIERHTNARLLYRAVQSGDFS
jgi:hypothetical protein